MRKYSDALVFAARTLFIKRLTPQEIASELNIPVQTVYNWASKFRWSTLVPAESIEEAISRRYASLSVKNNKTELELAECRDLVTQHVKLIAQRNKHEERMAEIRAKMHEQENAAGNAEQLGT